MFDSTAAAAPDVSSGISITSEKSFTVVKPRDPKHSFADTELFVVVAVRVDSRKAFMMIRTTN